MSVPSRIADNIGVLIDDLTECKRLLMSLIPYPAPDKDARDKLAAALGEISCAIRTLEKVK